MLTFVRQTKSSFTYPRVKFVVELSLVGRQSLTFLTPRVIWFKDKVYSSLRAVVVYGGGWVLFVIVKTYISKLIKFQQPLPYASHLHTCTVF